jgi:hypothetical protein
MKIENKNNIEFSCSECNSIVDEADKICPNCGIDLNDEIECDVIKDEEYSSKTQLYILQLNLPGKLLPIINIAFATGFSILLIYSVFVDQIKNNPVYIFISIFILFSSRILFHWWDILSGPVKIEVYNNGEVTLTNIYGYKKIILLSEIVLIDVKNIIIKIECKNIDFITSNNYKDFKRFISDVRSANPNLVCSEIENVT